MTSPAGGKLTQTLRQAIEAAPQRPFDLILRVRSADDQTQARLESAGFTVHNRLTLVPQFIATGPGQIILSLLSEEWLLGVEADGPVHTW